MRRRALGGKASSAGRVHGGRLPGSSRGRSAGQVGIYIRRDGGAAVEGREGCSRRGYLRGWMGRSAVSSFDRLFTMIYAVAFGVVSSKRIDWALPMVRSGIVGLDIAIRGPKVAR